MALQTEMWPQSSAEAKPLVLEAIKLFGKFKPESLEWLIPFVRKNEGDWNTFVAMTREGIPVSIEQKATFGLPKWFIICRPCWDMMTNAGLRDPRASVEELLQHIFWRQHLIYRREQFSDLIANTMVKGRSFYDGVKVEADELCCMAARQLSRTQFPIANFPDLPLKGCDQIWCKCTWSPIRRNDR